MKKIAVIFSIFILVLNFRTYSQKFDKPRLIQTGKVKKAPVENIPKETEHDAGVSSPIENVVAGKKVRNYSKKIVDTETKPMSKWDCDHWKTWFDYPEYFDGGLDPEIIKAFNQAMPDVLGKNENQLLIKMFWDNIKGNKIKKILEFDWDNTELIDQLITDGELKNKILSRCK